MLAGRGKQVNILSMFSFLLLDMASVAGKEFRPLFL
jgi:hypothetical protein